MSQQAVAASVTQEAKCECVTAVSSKSTTTVHAKEEKSVSNYGLSELAVQGSNEAHTPIQFSQAVSKSGMVVTPHLQSSITLQGTSPQSGINDEANVSLDNETMNPVHDTSDSNILSDSNAKSKEVNDDELIDDAIPQNDEQCREESHCQVPKPPPVPNRSSPPVRNYSSKKPHPITLETSPNQVTDESEQVCSFIMCTVYRL